MDTCIGTCKEKCEVCTERGYNCCENFTPTFSSSELAKLHYETDAIENAKLGIYQVGNNQFMAIEPKQVNGKTIKVDKSDCPFLTNGSCGIYDFRPAGCREYGSSVDCGFSRITLKDFKDAETDLLSYLKINNSTTRTKMIKNVAPVFGGSVPKITELNKKQLKRLPQDMLFYLLGNVIQRASIDTLSSRGITLKPIYRLVFVNNKIAGLKIYRYKMNNSPYNALIDLYNKTSSKLYINSMEYHELARNKLNSILKGIVFKDIENLPEEYQHNLDVDMIMMAHIMYRYYSDYKMKLKDYGGLTKHHDLYKIISDFNKATGGNAFIGGPQSATIKKYADLIYEKILFNK